MAQIEAEFVRRESGRHRGPRESLGQMASRLGVRFLDTFYSGVDHLPGRRQTQAAMGQLAVDYSLPNYSYPYIAEELFEPNTYAPFSPRRINQTPIYF